MTLCLLTKLRSIITKKPVVLDRTTGFFVCFYYPPPLFFDVLYSTKHRKTKGVDIIIELKHLSKRNTYILAAVLVITFDIKGIRTLRIGNGNFAAPASTAISA